MIDLTSPPLPPVESWTKAQSVANAEAVFLARLKELGATPAYTYWQGARTPHLVICKEGHECWPCPTNVQRGQGVCQICAGNDPQEAEQNFLVRLCELGATPAYDYWQGKDIPLLVICKSGHECWPRPTDVQHGQGVCRICAGNDPQTAEQNFLVKLCELGATPAYDYWQGNNVPLLVICKAGHECWPRPANVQKGQGICRTCARQDPVTAEQNFLDRLAEIDAIAAYGTWQGALRPHKVICNAGHICYPSPAHVQQGRGICAECAGKIWDVFYIVTSDSAVKFGITSGDPRPRLNDHKADGFANVLFIAIGVDARLAESEILQSLKLAGYVSVRGREYFDIECLDLVLEMVEKFGFTNEVDSAKNSKLYLGIAPVRISA